MLRSSGVKLGQLGQRGYRTATTKADLRALGFAEAQRRVPALVIPIWGVAGEIVSYQIRPDAPRVLDGKIVKYETPKNSTIHIDVPPCVRQRLRDPAVPLFVTEGVKKADSAAGAGMCCIALLGVWNWRGKNDLGGLTALADWDLIALKGRQVHVVFDSDVTTKPAVRSALRRLKAFLELRGATVHVVYLPSEPDGRKVGLDDFLVKGKTVDDILALARDELAPGDDADDDAPQPYEITVNGIFRVLRSDEGTERVRLTNFSARIVKELSLDDGSDVRRSFEVVATLGTELRAFTLDAEEFGKMQWPVTRIGAGATVFPTRGALDHVRAAIQLCSGMMAEREIAYTHTGWRELAGEQVFLHGAGAIGPRGAIPSVRVSLPAVLGGYVFPAPTSDTAVRGCVRNVVGLLSIGARHAVAALLCGVFRVVLDPVDFALYLHGRSGTFKTELSAVIQQFFGPAMDARHLPGSWSSTANSLEAAAHYAKDVVFVIDDFAPTGGATGMDRMQATLDRILRSQGNQAGRARCRVDGDVRAERHPRGMIVVTGEEVPRGASAVARALLLEIRRDDIDPERLTGAQAMARRGDFAQATANYVQWLAPRLASIRGELPGWVERARGEIGVAGQHRRIPGAIADLLFGCEILGRFARDVGALSADEVSAFTSDVRKLLEETALSQGQAQLLAEPHRRFLPLLLSVLASGDAHMVGRSGSRPDEPGRWGWRVSSAANEESSDPLWLPQGRSIGWVDGDDVYLDTAPALRVAQALADGSGTPLEITAATLSRRIRDAGMLASTDSDGQHIEVYRTLGGTRRRVLHVRASVFASGDVAGDRDAVAERQGVTPTAPSPAAAPELVTGPCLACGNEDHWITTQGDSRCRNCHPPAIGAERGTGARGGSGGGLA
jgi:hypothetical protein